MKRGGPRKPRGDADDPKYLAFVRTLPCAFSRIAFCYGATEAHHLTGAGMGQKARDDETMPLCQLHHRDLHEFTGFFRPMSRDDRAAWQTQQVQHTRELYARHQENARQ